MRVAFKIKNYIGKIPAARNIRYVETYKESGIYQLAQITRKRYIGQSGYHFIYGLMNLSAISRTLNTNSNFSQHLRENKHI